jgi:DNA-binding LacI/PurR family transcriptional regulator
MSPRKRITHQDVARLAGVSTAVVSYVINNGPRPTSPEVRERVNQAIRALDYHPNAAAFKGLYATQWNYLMAASTVMIAPIIVLFFLTQRYFVQGIVMSGTKG